MDNYSAPPDQLNQHIDTAQQALDPLGFVFLSQYAKSKHLDERKKDALKNSIRAAWSCLQLIHELRNCFASNQEHNQSVNRTFIAVIEYLAQVGGFLGKPAESYEKTISTSIELDQKQKTKVITFTSPLLPSLTPRPRSFSPNPSSGSGLESL